MTDKRIIFIATYYGLNSQTTKTIEELAELIKALAKPQSLEDITSEIADVEIMLEQLQYLYNNKKEVEDIKDYKLDRQIKRIGEENG